MADVDITKSGPIFDGRADRAYHDFSRKVAEEVADEGQKMVTDRLHEVIRHPTGYYESHIQVQVQSELNRVITDGGIVYGSWLEGESERNRTTRFKGYRTFRLITQELDKKSGEIAERILPRYIMRME